MCRSRRMITVQPLDASLIRAIEKAIRDSDLGRQSIQRRQDHPHSYPAADRRTPPRPGQEAEPHRRRAPRRHAQHSPRRQRSIEEAEKEKLISEDEERQALDAMQKLTDAQIGKIDTPPKPKKKRSSNLSEPEAAVAANFQRATRRPSAASKEHMAKVKTETHELDATPLTHQKGPHRAGIRHCSPDAHWSGRKSPSRKCSKSESGPGGHVDVARPIQEVPLAGFRSHFLSTPSPVR